MQIRQTSPCLSLLFHPLVLSCAHRNVRVCLGSFADCFLLLLCQSRSWTALDPSRQGAPVLISRHSLVPGAGPPGEGEKCWAQPKVLQHLLACQGPSPRIKNILGDHQCPCPHQETINSTWLRSSLSPRCWAEYSLACPPCPSMGTSIPPPPAWKFLDPPASRGDTHTYVLGSEVSPPASFFGQEVLKGSCNASLPSIPSRTFPLSPGGVAWAAQTLTEPWLASAEAEPKSAWQNLKSMWQR